jgi:hypothetical protein
VYLRRPGLRLAADASPIEADANRQNATPEEDWDTSAINPDDATRAVREYLDVLDDAAFGAATIVEPKFTSHSDPSSQWTARKGPAFFDYSTNYLIDTDPAVIVDIEATRSILQSEVGSVRTMLDRVKCKFDLDPERIIADTAYGAGPMLGWLVDRKTAPHIPVIDKASRGAGEPRCLPAAAGSRAFGDHAWHASRRRCLSAAVYRLWPQGHRARSHRVRGKTDRDRWCEPAQAGRCPELSACCVDFGPPRNRPQFLGDAGWAIK